jgi:hypothetical protein
LLNGDAANSIAQAQSSSHNRLIVTRTRNHQGGLQMTLGLTNGAGAGGR